MVALLLPSALSPGAVAGTALWAITGYLVLSSRVPSLMEWIYARLSPTTQLGSEPTPGAPPDHGLFSLLAALLSVVPFVGLGALTQFGLTLSLGGSWGVSLGVITAMVCGIYELGRRDSEASG
ncbi:MAG: hypothetical protein VKL98_07300 [Cyanobacteriota bacterium]|nr:hypothetical protein [Cyanobacteriota bacterium]